MYTVIYQPKKDRVIQEYCPSTFTALHKLRSRKPIVGGDAVSVMEWD